MPWLAPYRAHGADVARRVAAGATVAQALNAALQARPVLMPAGRPLSFVPQGGLPAGEAYESFIARTACVPTRDNPHDLFNGLVWLRFAPLKRRLNVLHAAQIAGADRASTCEPARVAGARAAVGGPVGAPVRGPVRGPARGPVRDALTLFDENAALLQAPAELVAALRRRDWQALFVQHRGAWHHARLTLFGHALLEKLMQPRKAITAHVWPLPEGAARDSDADAGADAGADAELHASADTAPETSLAATLTEHWLAQHRHCPLPVLGVPGWWPANEDTRFYQDVAVFRPPAGL